jgi:hypothetical protein
MTVPANTSTPFPRHLAGANSPPGFPSAYASTITDIQAWLHERLAVFVRCGILAPNHFVV